MASGFSRLGFTKSGDGPDLTMSQPTLQRYRRHREYYIDGGDIVFLVGLPLVLRPQTVQFLTTPFAKTGCERTFSGAQVRNLYKDL